MNFARDSRRAGPAAIVALLNRPLLAALWPPLLVMALLTASLALRHYLAGAAAAGAAVAQAPAVLKNPFSLGAAIRFRSRRTASSDALMLSPPNGSKQVTRALMKDEGGVSRNECRGNECRVKKTNDQTGTTFFPSTLDTRPSS